MVEREPLAGSTVSAANGSEVTQKSLAGSGDWDLASLLLLSYGLAVEPVLAVDAERAGHLWRRGSGLSLADRLCLALRERRSATAWTADAAWGESAQVRQVR